MLAAKEDLKSSVKEKEAMEKEIAQIEKDLLQYEGKGFDGSLVDEEGFPKSDLDFMELKEYRLKKKRAIELVNDINAITDVIHKKLEIYHSYLQNETGDK